MGARELSFEVACLLLWCTATAVFSLEHEGKHPRLGALTFVEMQGKSGQMDHFDNPSNPYCRVCQAVFNEMVFLGEPEKFTTDALCRLVPFSFKKSCALLASGMIKNEDVKATLKSGCLDKTGTTLTGVPAKVCPGVLACNILEAHSGAPMCGFKLRGWADFLPNTQKDRPVRPSLRDNVWQADGHVLGPNGGVLPVNFAPPGAGSEIVGGNVNCDMCIDVFNDVQNKRTPSSAFLRRRRALSKEGDSLCANQPNSLKSKCEDFVTLFRDNLDVKQLLEYGCMDRSGPDPIEMNPSSCAGEVACNAIHDEHGGPMCGSVYGQIGTIAGHNPNLVEWKKVKLP